MVHAVVLIPSIPPSLAVLCSRLHTSCRIFLRLLPQRGPPVPLLHLLGDFLLSRFRWALPVSLSRSFSAFFLLVIFMPGGHIPRSPLRHPSLRTTARHSPPCGLLLQGGANSKL